MTIAYRPGRTTSWFTLPAFLLLGVGGTLLALSSLGYIGGPPAPTRLGPPPPGWVAVPRSSRKIAAFAQVTRDDVLDPRTMELTVLNVPEAEVQKHGILVRPEDIINRVAAREKPIGYAFTEYDFLPKNTRPGPAGGIPAGKRGMRLEAAKVHGIHGFRAGDRFDIVATALVNVTPMSPSIITGAHSTPPAPIGQPSKAARVRVVVENGVIIAPVTVRDQPTGPSNPLVLDTHDKQTKPIEEVVIAVDPTEVAPLAESLATGAELQCVPRSGRPDDPKDSKTPGLEPPPPPPPPPPASKTPPQGATVETIGGNTRDVKHVPKAGS